MKITIDKKAGTAYLYFVSDESKKDIELRTVPVDENIVVDYLANGRLYGIEILSLQLLNMGNLKNIEIEYY